MKLCTPSVGSGARIPTEPEIFYERDLCQTFARKDPVGSGRRPRSSPLPVAYACSVDPMQRRDAARYGMRRRSRSPLATCLRPCATPASFSTKVFFIPIANSSGPSSSPSPPPRRRGRAGHSYSPWGRAQRTPAVYSPDSHNAATSLDKAHSLPVWRLCHITGSALAGADAHDAAPGDEEECVTIMRPRHHRPAGSLLVRHLPLSPFATCSQARGCRKRGRSTTTERPHSERISYNSSSHGSCLRAPAPRARACMLSAACVLLVSICGRIGVTTDVV